MHTWTHTHTLLQLWCFSFSLRFPAALWPGSSTRPIISTVSLSFWRSWAGEAELGSDDLTAALLAYERTLQTKTASGKGWNCKKVFQGSGSLCLTALAHCLCRRLRFQQCVSAKCAFQQSVRFSKVCDSAKCAFQQSVRFSKVCVSAKCAIQQSVRFSKVCYSCMLAGLCC